MAGSGVIGAITNGSPAPSSPLATTFTTDAVRNADGYVYLVTQAGGTFSIVRYGAPTAGASVVAGHKLLPSKDGSELYEFNSLGQHVATRSPDRGKPLYCCR